MKTVYLTSALILTLGGAALAQTATPAVPPAADAAASTPAAAAKTGLLRASAFKGADIYTVDVTGKTKWDDGVAYTEINTDWDKIGEVEDLVLDPPAISSAPSPRSAGSWASAKRKSSCCPRKSPLW